MKVELLSYTPEAEKIVASAAKLCYSHTGASGLKDNLDDQKVEKFLNMLMSMGHESPVEHVNFTFAIEGVSRVLTHQLVRHRIASYSQQSQRYVKLDQFEYIVPPAVEENELAMDIFMKHMLRCQEAYDGIVDNLLEQYASEYLTSIGTSWQTINCTPFCLLHNMSEEDKANGKVHKKKLQEIEKRAIEDARYVFPNACETKIVVTMNARTLFNFFEKRCCNRAQWEIQSLACKMLKLCKDVAPVLFKYAGPPCLHGTCGEGSMSCGKANEIRQKLLV